MVAEGHVVGLSISEDVLRGTHISDGGKRCLRHSYRCQRAGENEHRHTHLYFYCRRLQEELLQSKVRTVSFINRLEEKDQEKEAQATIKSKSRQGLSGDGSFGAWRQHKLFFSSSRGSREDNFRNKRLLAFIALPVCLQSRSTGRLGTRPKPKQKVQRAQMISCQVGFFSAVRLSISCVGWETLSVKTTR